MANAPGADALIRLKMIATDLDGTFLGDDTMPSALNIEAVRRAAAAGIHIVFATGRPARWLQPVDAVMDVHPDAIASNGGVIWNVAEHRLRAAFPLPREDTLSLMADVTDALPTVSFAVEYIETWGRQPGFPRRGDFVEAAVISDDHAALLDGGLVVKLLIYGPDILTDHLADLVTPLVKGRLDLTYSIIQPNGILELSAPGVSKASALQVLMDDYGVDASEVAAFGDMPNDLDMLQLAGYPFVMSNAHPTVLAQGFPDAGHHDDSGFGRIVMALLDEMEAASSR